MQHPFSPRLIRPWLQDKEVVPNGKIRENKPKKGRQIPDPGQRGGIKI